MFEAQVAYYLNKYLGQFLTGLDAESLRISVWKGDVELRNLGLRPEALQGLDLPITVKSGLLGKLTLKVGEACVRTGSLALRPTTDSHWAPTLHCAHHHRHHYLLPGHYITTCRPSELV